MKRIPIFKPIPKPSSTKAQHANVHADAARATRQQAAEREAFNRQAAKQKPYPDTK